MLKTQSHLERLNAKRRQARFCAMHVKPTLFGDWTLVREWGRIGTGGHTKMDWFDREIDAAYALGKIERQKLGKGYR